MLIRGCDINGDGTNDLYTVLTPGPSKKGGGSGSQDSSGCMGWLILFIVVLPFAIMFFRPNPYPPPQLPQQIESVLAKNDFAKAMAGTWRYSNRGVHREGPRPDGSFVETPYNEETTYVFTFAPTTSVHGTYRVDVKGKGYLNQSDRGYWVVLQDSKRDETGALLSFVNMRGSSDSTELVGLTRDTLYVLNDYPVKPEIKHTGGSIESNWLGDWLTKDRLETLSRQSPTK